ncbi:hypothetical protein LSAT2_004737 [Lamellibrachia satsuma]|nr:hypothetical protein LSAT2_004737 [Lamellibrachia satsuma]
MGSAQGKGKQREQSSNASEQRSTSRNACENTSPGEIESNESTSDANNDATAIKVENPEDPEEESSKPELKLDDAESKVSPEQEIRDGKTGDDTVDNMQADRGGNAIDVTEDTEDVPSTHGAKLDDAELKVFPEQKNIGEGECDDGPVDYVPTDSDGNATDTENPSTRGTKLDDGELQVSPEQNIGKGDTEDDTVDYVPTDSDGNATDKTEG